MGNTLYSPHKKKTAEAVFCAESTGFEPVDTLRYRQFSKLLVSATHPTLRSAVTLKRCAKIVLFRNNAKYFESLSFKILAFVEFSHSYTILVELHLHLHTQGER